MAYVDVPDSVQQKLCSFLREHEILGNSIVPECIMVLNVNNSKDSVFKNGVYRFRLNAVHSETYFFINYNSDIRIFTSHNIDDRLKEFLSFIENKHIPNSNKHYLLKALVKTMPAN